MKTTQLFRLISIINSLFIIPACSAQNPSQSIIEDIFEDLSVNNSVDNAVNEPNWENELEELSVRLHEPVDLNRLPVNNWNNFLFSVIFRLNICWPIYMCTGKWRPFMNFS